MKNTTENNKLIAEFMQWEKIQDGTYKSTDFFHLEGEGYSTYMDYVWDVKDMEFNEDWNWLMPVVEKIYNNDLYYKKYIDYNSSMFTDGEIKLTTQISTVYNQVIEFIKWHNLNK